jgi:protein disulfide-isomerase
MILILILMVTVVGSCKDNAKAGDAEPVTEETEPSFDEAMGQSSYSGEWIESWSDALKLAGELDRPILINFTGSDWCSWCIKLSDEVFTKQEFIDYAKANLILLKLDFPKRIPQSNELKMQNRNLQNKFNINGYPTIVLADKEGTEIQRTGYQPGGAVAYVSHLQELLKTK